MKKTPESSRRFYLFALQELVEFAFGEAGSAPPSELALRLRFTDTAIRGAMTNLNDTETRERLRRQLRRSIDDFFEMDSISWTAPESAVEQIRLSSLQVMQSSRGEWFRSFEGTGGDAGFWFAVAEAMQQAGRLLRRCETVGCSRVYVRHRGQVRCSKACGQRARSAAWYAKHHGKAQAAKHAAYARKRHRVQPKAKVARRPRR